MLKKYIEGQYDNEEELGLNQNENDYNNIDDDH